VEETLGEKADEADEEGEEDEEDEAEGGDKAGAGGERVLPDRRQRGRKEEGGR